MVARRRVIIVYNSRSSRARRVEDEVIVPWRKSGWMVGKYKVVATNVDDNAKKLARILIDGDLVVAAGGDGTATIALNAAMLSGKDVMFSVMPYGNFNDTARTLVRLANDGGKMLYPLEALVNGRHWRYATSYFTVGMLAESTKIFDQEEEREYLRRHEGGFWYSIRRLMSWYFRNKNGEFLPAVKMNGVRMEKSLSDFFVVNGVTVARMMKGGKWGLEPRKFYCAHGELRNFFGLLNFLSWSALGRMPGRITKGEIIEFENATDVAIQAEGEYERIKNVKMIEFRKTERGIRIWNEKSC